MVGGCVVERFGECDGQLARLSMVGGRVHLRRDHIGEVHRDGGRPYGVAGRVIYGGLFGGHGRGGAAQRLQMGGVQCRRDGLVGGCRLSHLGQGDIGRGAQQFQQGMVGGGVVEGLAECDVQLVGLDMVDGRVQGRRCHVRNVDRVAPDVRNRIAVHIVDGALLDVQKRAGHVPQDGVPVGIQREGGGVPVGYLGLA